MYESDKGIYDMILGRYILTALVLNLKKYEQVILAGDIPLKGFTSPIIDLHGTHGTHCGIWLPFQCIG